MVFAVQNFDYRNGVTNQAITINESDKAILKISSTTNIEITAIKNMSVTINEIASQNFTTFPSIIVDGRYLNKRIFESFKIDIVPGSQTITSDYKSVIKTDLSNIALNGYIIDFIEWYYFLNSVWIKSPNLDVELTTTKNFQLIGWNVSSPTVYLNYTLNSTCQNITYINTTNITIYNTSFCNLSSQSFINITNINLTTVCPKVELSCPNTDCVEPVCNPPVCTCNPPPCDNTDMKIMIADLKTSVDNTIKKEENSTGIFSGLSDSIQDNKRLLIIAAIVIVIALTLFLFLRKPKDNIESGQQDSINQGDIDLSGLIK